MDQKPMFHGLPTSPGYGEGFDDGLKVGGRQPALFRESFECHQTMGSTVKPEDFAKAAARANELRGIFSGEQP